VFLDRDHPEEQCNQVSKLHGFCERLSGFHQLWGHLLEGEDIAVVINVRVIKIPDN